MSGDKLSLRLKMSIAFSFWVLVFAYPYRIIIWVLVFAPFVAILLSIFTSVLRNDNGYYFFDLIMIPGALLGARAVTLL
jgi:hypothetical protein